MEFAETTAKLKRRTSKGSGRPDLRSLGLPEERVEILDDELEGKAERVGFETTYLLGRRRVGTFVVVLARATYKKTAADGTTELVTVDKPKELYERGMLAPSFIAFVLTKKFRWGMPFHRLALELASGASRSTTARCAATPSMSARRSAASSMRW